MRSRSPEPLSPELVLVAPADEAERAREELSDDRLWVALDDKPHHAREELGSGVSSVAPAEEAQPVPQEPSNGASWNEFLVDVRSRPEPNEDKEVEVERWERPRRRPRPRLLLIGLGLVALLVAGVAAASWMGNRSDTKESLRAAPVLSTAATPSAVLPPAQGKPTKTAPRRTRGTFAPARVFSWPAARGSRYHVRFWRDGTKVLDVRTAKPRLVLPRTFVFKPGRYRWMVVAVRGGTKRSLVDSAFVVAQS
jgi:hypothetical protein